MIPINVPIYEFDKSILIFINQFHSPTLDKIIVAISNIGEYAFIWIVIALLLALTNKKVGKEFLIVLAAALILEVIFNDGIIKHLFFRERPYLSLSGIHHMGPNWINSSFVSGHTASSIVSTIIISKYFKAMIAPCIAIILLMIYSRFYLGMHYPTDIIGGILLGAISAIISLKFTKKRLK